MNDTRTSTTFEKYRGTPAEIYERHFVPAIGTPCAHEVVDAATLQPGDRVLDVACGTGVATRLAAERVGSGGAVAAIDGHPGMLAVARRTVRAGAPIDWREASADGLPFRDDSFDAVVCSISLQFFADRVGALVEMSRVLTPGGRVALGVPGPTPPLFGDLADVLAERLGPEPAAFVEAVFAIDDPGRLRELVAAAELDDVAVTSRPVRLHLGPPADFLWQYLLATPLAPAVTSLGEPERNALEAEIVPRWAPFVTGDGMETDVDLIVATAIAR